MLRELLKAAVGRHGFLSGAELEVLADEDRLRPVLVRCNGGRFTCAAQDAGHFIRLLESTGQEWARDVSLPAGDRAFLGDYRHYTPALGRIPERQPVEAPARSGFPKHCYVRNDCHNYGGAFDGFTVTSDADPGL